MSVGDRLAELWRRTEAQPLTVPRMVAHFREERALLGADADPEAILQAGLDRGALSFEAVPLFLRTLAGQRLLAFDPNQARDELGRWTDEGGATGGPSLIGGDPENPGRFSESEGDSDSDSDSDSDDSIGEWDPVANDAYLYHVTWAKNLPSIEENGLLPGGGESMTPSALGGHATGRVFVTEGEGVSFWTGKSEEWGADRYDDQVESGAVPVVIRVTKPIDVGDDEVGSEDSRAGAYYTKDPIGPSALEVFDGKSWVPIREIDHRAAADEDGYILTDDRNPLIPKGADMSGPKRQLAAASPKSDPRLRLASLYLNRHLPRIDGWKTAAVLHAEQSTPLELPGLDDFTTDLYEASLRARLMAHEAVDLDLEIGSGDWVKLPTDALASRFLAREAIPRGLYDLLDQEARTQAFTVARVTNQNVLDAIQARIASNIAAGGHLRDFEKEIDEVFSENGWDPLDPWHLETVYRTNVMSAYGERARMAMEAQAERRPLWKWHAILDHRVRESHAAVHGLVMRHDDPRWDEVYPPAGYNCRCVVRAVHEDDVGDDELVDGEDPRWDAVVDPGFQGGGVTLTASDPIRSKKPAS